MPAPKSLGRIEAEKLCKKFPNAGSLTLAKRLYKEFPEYYKDVESARSIVRNIFGLIGKVKETYVADKSLFRPPRVSGFVMPESHAEERNVYKVSSSRILVISDLHIPYQDNEAVVAALKYGKEKKVNCIIINGDLMDFHHQSRFEKDPRARSTKQEFDATRQFLQMLRNEFPEAKIIYKQGNHDLRWEKWLFHKAPEIFDDPEFKLEVRLRLGELSIVHLTDKVHIQAGKLTIIHGHELQGSGGVNPARATFLKTIDNVLIGHCHRSSQHVEPTMGGDVIMTTSQGCLCGLYPEFSSVNKWNHGASYIDLDVKTGEYELENFKIINGKIYK